MPFIPCAINRLFGVSRATSLGMTCELVYVTNTVCGCRVAVSPPNSLLRLGKILRRKRRKLLITRRSVVLVSLVLGRVEVDVVNGGPLPLSTTYFCRYSRGLLEPILSRRNVNGEGVIYKK